MKKFLSIALLSSLAFSTSVFAESSDVGKDISISAVNLRTANLPNLSLTYRSEIGLTSVLLTNIGIEYGSYNASEVFRLPQSQKNSAAQAICNKVGLGDLIKVNLNGHQVAFDSKYIENGIVAHTNESLKFVFALYSELPSLYPNDSKLITIDSIECKKLEPSKNGQQISIPKL